MEPCTCAAVPFRDVNATIRFPPKMERKVLSAISDGIFWVTSDMQFRILGSWRVMAALLVMVFHFLNYGPPSAVAGTFRLLSLMPLLDTFLIISGFLIMERYSDRLLMERGSYRHFLVRRVARFYPLYLVTLAYFVGIGILVNLGFGGSDTPGRYDFAALPANILLVQGWGVTSQLTFNYVGWTLSAEWFCYLLLPVIVLAWRGFGLKGLAALAVLAILLLEAMVATGLMPFEKWYYADTWGAYRAFADFAVGGFLAMASRKVTLRFVNHAVVWGVFALAIVLMWNGLAGYPALALLSLAIFLAAVAERQAPQASGYLAFLDGLSVASFSLYLIHPVVASVMLNIGWRRILEPMQVMSFYAFLPVAIIVAIALAIASSRWFEPRAAKAINGLFAPSKPRQAAAV